MKLYTKQGDAGQTRLANGAAVPKDHLRITAYGEVDELNAALGLAICACGDSLLAERVKHIQDRLFVLGAELADPARSAKTPVLTDQDVQQLETWIDEATDAVEPLRSFILPAGCETAVRLHLGRAICRRAERSVVALSAKETVSPIAIVFTNRLSDLLFAWARLANKLAGVADVPWTPPKGPQHTSPDGT